MDEEYRRLSMEFEDCVREAEKDVQAGDLEGARQWAIDALTLIKLMIEIRYGPC